MITENVGRINVLQGKILGSFTDFLHLKQHFQHFNSFYLYSISFGILIKQYFCKNVYRHDVTKVGDFYMGKFLILCRIQLKFCSWLYKKRWHTSWKFQLEKTSNKKVTAKKPLTNLYEMNSSHCSNDIL